MSPDGRKLLPSRLANLVTSTMIDSVPHRQYLSTFPDTLEQHLRDTLIAKEIETSLEPQTQFSPLKTQNEESDTEEIFFTPPQKQLAEMLIEAPPVPPVSDNQKMDDEDPFVAEG